MTAPRAVVFGASGMLGQALLDELMKHEYMVVAPDRANCSIRDVAAVEKLVKTVRPAVIFNAAAHTNVDDAETNHFHAYATNVIGSGVVTCAAAKYSAKVVLYSTDFVFDGQLTRPYRETDWPQPVNAYGRTKADADRALRLRPGALILRIGSLYGRGGRNFPSTLLSRLRAGQEVVADNERLVAPTWAGDVARVSVALAQTDITGLYHLAPKGSTTWAEFVQRIVRRLELADGRVRGVPTDDLRLVAARPKHVLLDSSLLALRGFGLPRWEESLNAYLDEETST